MDLFLGQGPRRTQGKSALVHANSLELDVLAANITHLIIFQVVKLCEITVILHLNVWVLKKLFIFCIVINIYSIVVASLWHLSYERVHTQSRGGQ